VATEAEVDGWQMGGGTEAAAGRLVMTLGIALEAMGSTGATAGASPPPRSRWRLVAEALAQRMNKSVRVISTDPWIRR
jgi:hypothetical protein